MFKAATDAGLLEPLPLPKLTFSRAAAKSPPELWQPPNEEKKPRATLQLPFSAPTTPEQVVGVPIIRKSRDVAVESAEEVEHRELSLVVADAVENCKAQISLM